jgi:hypothetical protein
MQYLAALIIFSPAILAAFMAMFGAIGPALGILILWGLVFGYAVSIRN